MFVEKKKPYRKPEIHEVRLITQESVLMVCKVADLGGPGQPTSGCKGDIAQQCALLGS
jgi:hypothetical protein